MDELKKEDLSQVTGGGNQGSTGEYQLYINDTPLTMTNTVEQMTQTYPQIKTLLGFMYSMFKNMTLNQVCAQVGQETVQNLLNQYAG